MRLPNSPRRSDRRSGILSDSWLNPEYLKLPIPFGADFCYIHGVVPQKTQTLIQDLREQLRALDLAIATFERLASIREQQETSREKKPKMKKTARTRPAPPPR
jgi:hypothetical protein